MDGPTKMNVALVFLVIVASALGAETTVQATNETEIDHAATIVDVFRKDDTYWYRECNGVLVDPRWVLTPSYCVRAEGLQSEFKVIFERAEIPVRDIFKPNGYILTYIDVALLRLGYALKNVTNIKLPPKDFNITGTLNLYTWNRKHQRKVLNVTVQQLTECKDTTLLPEIHVCVGDSTNSTVKGQEGSAIVKKDPKAGDILAGILLSAHTYYAPAVYTRISRYTSWITKTIGRDAT